MKLRLFHNNLEIGEIVQSEQNFPNLFGQLKLNQSINWDLSENRLLRDYIDYSVNASKLMEESEKDWLDFMAKGEWKFQTLINSGEWYVIDENGEKSKILIPNFCDKNEIVWRWNI